MAAYSKDANTEPRRIFAVHQTRLHNATPSRRSYINRQTTHYPKDRPRPARRNRSVAMSSEMLRSLTWTLVLPR
jgi:hypothetical protein